jgi:predicted ATPase
MSQAELAERAGLSVHAIGAIERGVRRRPHPHTLRALVAALDLPTADKAALFAAARATGDGGHPGAAALPVPPTPLIGREAEMRHLVSVLAPPGARLTTLTGPAGVGKTRLALAAAGELAPMFGDGTAVVSLSAIRDSRLVLPTIARVLSVRESGAAGLRKVLHGYLASRQVLLLLDNFEHVLDAAPEIADMLAAAPGVTVLATSRAPLHLTGERLCPLAPLAPAAAAMLFLERSACATANRDDADTATAMAICARLDNLPLAIELAAARTRVLPARALLARLDRALELLRGGARDLPERQQTLRTAIGWSYDLLTADEQALFRRLGAFRGGWGLDAAAAVGEVDGDHALDLLGGLIDNSLVIRGHPGGEPRYSQLETIQAYAVEKLETCGEKAAANACHAAYYRDVALGCAAELFGAAQPIRLDQLHLEHDNLAAASRYLLHAGRVGDLAQMCYALWLFWSIRGHLSEGEFWTGQVLAHPGQLGSADRAKVLFTSAGMLFPRGRYPEAAGRLRTAAELAREAGDRSALGWILGMWGFVEVFRGLPGSAAPLLEEARVLATRTADPYLAPLALTGLAYVAIEHGQLTVADRMLYDAEAEMRESGAPWSLAVTLNVHGRVALLLGDCDRTADLVPEAVTILARLQDEWSMVQALTNLADAAVIQSHPRQAARLYGAVDAIVERSGATVFPLYWDLSCRCRSDAAAQLGGGAFEGLRAEGATLPIDKLAHVTAG